MPKNIASIYPCPFDGQLRHEFNSSVYSNGDIFAYEESKITSIKNDPTAMFPEKSLIMGLKELNLKPNQIDLWVLPKPKNINPENLYLFFSDLFKAYTGKKKLFKKWIKNKVKFILHHDMHIYSSIGSSGFKKGVYLSADGGGDEGDRRNFTWGHFNKLKIKEYNNLKGLNSLANFHAFVTEFCGFRDQNGKVSGLSAYGKIQKKLKRKLEKTLIISDKGIAFNRIRRNITEPDFNNFDCNSYDRVKVFRNDISKTNIFDICSGYLPQDVALTAEIILSEQINIFLKKIKNKYFKNFENIVFTGGLFLNVKINESIQKSKIFKNCFFPVAPSDSGLALGGVLSQNIKLKKKYTGKLGLSPYLGPSFDKKEIYKQIKIFKLNYSIPHKIENDIAQEIKKKKIIGIFFERAEYGQRSLGNRSILADPRDKFSKERLNQKIKKRDWFMPFAPAILDKCYSKYFNCQNPSYYMQKAVRIKDKVLKSIPSAVHVDKTSRVQFVDKKISPKFWRIINEFYKISGMPVVLNTSFNRHGISTICSPRQAIEHLLEGSIDILYLEKYKISFSENRKFKKYNEKIEREKKLLKKNNINWLKKNKILMKKKLITQYKRFLQNLS